MDRNFILALALSFLVVSLWMSWQESRREAFEEANPSTVERPQAEGEMVSPEGRNIPTGVPERVEAQRPAPAAPVRVAEERAAEERIRVEGSSYRAGLSSWGGVLTDWELTEYSDRSGPVETPVVLTTVDGAEAELTTPFVELGIGDLSRAPFEVERADARTVAFERTVGGVTVRKVYRFEPEGYGYRLRLEVDNQSNRMLASPFGLHWTATRREGPDFSEQALVALWDGSVERGNVDGLGKEGLFSFGSTPPEGKTLARDVEWAGVENRYFLAVLIPEVPRSASARFQPLEVGYKGRVELAYQDAIEIPPGQRAAREFQGYVGPKERAALNAVEPSLARSINEGWSFIAPLTRFFSWLLASLYKYVPNYGVVIILITILVRLVTAPLTSRQMRSMKAMSEKMKVVQPKLQSLKEKYKDEPQRQQQEMMKVYREANMSPLGMFGGCLPMFLQFPVFIGLFYALQSAIELRQASFVAWIDDLSRPEELFVIPGIELPVRVLPLVMGGSMVLQQKLTPATTMDPAQQRMMMTLMPVMFTFMFYQFPSGLVLYWMVSNFLAIGHQVLINRDPTGKAAVEKTGAKPAVPAKAATAEKAD